MKTKSKLKILSLAEWDYAGVGFQLSQAINKFTDNHSDAVRWNTNYIEYPYQLLQPGSKMIAKLWKEADVIHIHDAFNRLPKGLQAKPTVITYHGSMYRRAPKRYDKLCHNNYYIQTVSTLDLTLLGKALWLPDTRFGYLEGLDRGINPGEFTVCHAPTSRPGKSTELVIEACKIAKVKLELIEKTTWDKCLDRKSMSHVLVDQFDLGYGCNAIEAWSMGLPVIANASDAIINCMIQIFGKLPFLQCEKNTDALAQAIRLFRAELRIRRDYIDRGKSHFERYHSPAATAQLACDYYHKAIELFWNRKPNTELEQSVNVVSKLVPRSGMVKIRYVSGNFGKESYKCPSGASYTFSAKEPVQDVLAKDAMYLLRLSTKGGGKKGRVIVGSKKLFEMV